MSSGMLAPTLQGDSLGEAYCSEHQRPAYKAFGFQQDVRNYRMLIWPLVNLVRLQYAVKNHL